jgi:hypothetical protein
MTEIVRQLDPQAVEAAEFFRKNHYEDIAVKAVDKALDFITPREISEISKDPNQRLIAACLFRIGVDSYKSLANKSIYAPEVLDCLEKATAFLYLGYLSPDLSASLQGVTKDHLGREHNFLSEMSRDKAKVLQSASSLYAFEPGNDLIAKAWKILQDTYNSLPDGHSTKALIGVEIGLLNARLGNVWVSDTLGHFEMLVGSDEDRNPHRVATVAAWLITWGEKTGFSSVTERGNEVFQRIIKSHSEWVSMSRQERQKTRLMDKRNMVLKLSAMFLTQSYRRSLLWNRLIDL